MQMAQSGLYDWLKTFAALDVVSVGGTPTCNVLTNAATSRRFRRLQAAQHPARRSFGDHARRLCLCHRHLALSRADQIRFGYRHRLSGSPFELPAGPVDIVVGAEYRSQSLALTTNADPSLLDTAAERLAYFGTVRGVPGSPTFAATARCSTG